MNSIVAAEMKKIALKHQIPIVVVISIDPKSGISQFLAIGNTPTLHTAARRVADKIRNIFKASGLFS